MDRTGLDHAYGPRTFNTGPDINGPRIVDTGPGAYSPRIVDTGPGAYSPRTVDTGPNTYGPRTVDTGPNTYGPRIVDIGINTCGPRTSTDYTTCSTNVIAPTVAMNKVAGFVALLIVLLELSHLWTQGRNDNVNPTLPAPPARSLWQFCHDVGESLDDEGSTNLGYLSRTRREGFMGDIAFFFQTLFAFEGECQEDLRHENSLQKQLQSQGSRAVAESTTDNIVMAASGPRATNRFKCPQCYKVLSRSDALERHQRSQHNRRVEEHLCPYKSCKHSRQGSGFARRDGLRRHLKACKSRPRRAATTALDVVDSQPESGNETREDSQGRSSSQDTRSTQGLNDASGQHPPGNSWVEELRKRREEAKEVYDRKKREFEEAQRVMESYETLIKNAEKERTT
ncbi:hypothetical protein CDV31_015437 [Fusarium ambrosium]|uniref:C2H2-type domain-containing protein n=1 Tax=Fusarium ambrosium TaxID=131363 RepID=A0A428SP05_9HYPO|nr:hypothetical protein CDV31_015437 [Fusarium ambrosium]